ncbi:PRC-barrel domain protein [Aciduliprofundum boonei T469]|uniref:PRC-barrel domain protein n=2 Tax=Candidatus Aciduliprofundum boonei TaxID=379547 RepID=D3TBG7_ACIB4|nr:PRC-barrel domain protein [Aciduliprofundum boonei T469]HII55007.1 photosystem reaction center subunit H [Candidatus Aciduliprofundum boonei]
MMTEVTELIGLEIYTDKGYLLGTIKDVLLDVNDQIIYGLYVEKSNPLLVEDGVPVVVPYRWVKAVGDVILLKKFPSYVNVT